MSEVTYETIIADQRKVIHELRQTIVAQDIEISGLESRESDLEEEVYTVTTERDNNEMRADVLQYEIDDLERQLDEVRDELFEAEAALDASEGGY